MLSKMKASEEESSMAKTERMREQYHAAGPTQWTDAGDCHEKHPITPAARMVDYTRFLVSPVSGFPVLSTWKEHRVQVKGSAHENLDKLELVQLSIPPILQPRRQGFWAIPVLQAVPYR